VTLTLLDQPDSTVPGERRRGGAEVGWGGSPPEAAASASRPAEAAARSLRVLVVDDNARMRGELRALLEDGGFTVVGEASHGAEGVTLARELRPNVVVMDLRMPILDGIAATGVPVQVLWAGSRGSTPWVGATQQQLSTVSGSRPRVWDSVAA
jgi:hypothetical protein